MKIGIYFCLCGPNIADRIDSEDVRRSVGNMPGFGFFRTVEFLCAVTGMAALEDDIRANRPDRIVVAACSVREHEETFRGLLSRAGMNPYLLQMVNIREHIAWVAADKGAATRKAVRAIRAAMNRVALHEPLERREIEICPDVLVIGAGPAGLKAALTVAEAGRKVYLVEREPVLGGLPVRFEEMSPRMECGSCVLEPALAGLFHGPDSERIEVFTLSEVTGVVGYYGNFSVTIRQAPRRISPSLCIACGACIPACPAVSKNPFNCGLNGKKAVDFPFLGGLPNLPYIDPESCLRTPGGEECTLCRDACPVEGAVVYEEEETVVQRQAGAILLATGAGLYDCRNLPDLGYGTVPDVYTSLEFERILSANGPTGGTLARSDGVAPERIAIIQCVGSLDSRHREYCSGICCGTAFKFHHVLTKKNALLTVTHFIKSVSVPGKEEYRLYEEAQSRESTRFVRYDDISDLRVARGENGRNTITCRHGTVETAKEEFDVIVLCPALVPSAGTTGMAGMLEIATDRFGFVEELHDRMDSAKTTVRGIFAAGTCQAPMDMRQAVNQSLAAAASILAGLVPGRKLVIEPITAVIDAARCSACRTCIPVCPYKAISFDAEEDSAAVNSVLCMGCGTCVAACPSAAIKGNHFTDEQLLAEIEGVLS